MCKAERDIGEGDRMIDDEEKCCKCRRLAEITTPSRPASSDYPPPCNEMAIACKLPSSTTKERERERRCINYKYRTIIGRRSLHAHRFESSSEFSTDFSFREEDDLEIFGDDRYPTV